MNNISRQTGMDMPRLSPRFYIIALVIAAIVLSGIWLVSRFTTADLARDMQSWREKLNLIAESRTEAVNEWVRGRFGMLHSLADNPSLQLFMTELQTQPDGNQVNTAQMAAQKAYLRNLLLFSAERGGFTDGAASEIKANIPQEGKNGLFVLDKNQEIVVSTSMDTAMRDVLLKQIETLPAGQESLIDIRKDKDGDLMMGFVVPVFSIQGERTPEAQIGRVVGITEAGKQLYGLLKHPGVMEKSLESILLRRARDKVEFLSPLQDGSQPLARQSDFETGKFAESSLVQSAGNFISEKKDYRDKPVLATSRTVPATPWTLMVKIDRQEALVESNQRRASMVALFFLIIALVVLIIVTIWWYAHSRRAIMMSHHFRKVAAQAAAQEELLRLVANNQPEPIYIVDAGQVYHFANRQAAEDANFSIESLPGKLLSDVRGAARAEAIGAQCRKALKQRLVQYEIATIPLGGEEKIIRSAYVPLERIPIASLPDTRGVLVVEQDISDVVHEREKRLEIQQQLVHTLVQLVDRRDPFAANHSTLVSMMAYEIARDMGLDEVTTETTRIAGNLMNIGKIIVAPELLAKTSDLTDEEKKTIRNSMQLAADLIKDIPFDGPVADTLRQWQERWDGGGPLGLKGEEILVSARIIAVANAFIGMISPRSWRAAMPIEKANRFLLDNADALFDRRVVVALVNHVENQRGKQWLRQAIEDKRSAA